LTDRSEPPPVPPAPDEGDGSPPAPSILSLEGRAVPALYLIGWVGSILGLGIVVVSLLSTSSSASGWIFLAGLALLGIGLVAAAGSQAVERGRRPDLAYRGPAPVLVFAAVVAIVLLVVVVVLAPLSVLGLDAGSPLATTLELALTALVYVALIRLLVVGPGALSWADMGLRHPAAIALRDLLLGAALGVPVLLVTLLLGGLLSRVVEPGPSVLPAFGNAAGLLLNLASAAIIAPIGEELFFRGFATTAWSRSIGAWPAIARGAAFFAAAHVLTLMDASFGAGVQHAAYAFITLMPVGLALGWVFLSRRSLYAAIGLHAAFNGLQILALFAFASGAAT